MKKKVKLLPCPFCLERFGIYLHKLWWSGDWCIDCVSCGARSPVNSCKEIVVAAWNRRTNHEK